MVQTPSSPSLNSSTVAILPTSPGTPAQFHVIFLDFDVRIDQGQLHTSVHIKPTNHQQYLHYHSCYLISTKCSIPYSLLPGGDSNGSLEKASTSSPQIHPPRTSSSNLPQSHSANPNLHTYNPANPTNSRPCNRPWCKTCSIHPPASSCANLTYPITTHADCKSMNLIYQLQCNVCNAFYIGETRRYLSDRMNGQCFTTTVSNLDLPVAIHTQSHQIPFQDCRSVSIIHKHSPPV